MLHQVVRDVNRQNPTSSTTTSNGLLSTGSTIGRSRSTATTSTPRSSTLSPGRGGRCRIVRKNKNVRQKSRKSPSFQLPRICQSRRRPVHVFKKQSAVKQNTSSSSKTATISSVGGGVNVSSGPSTLVDCTPSVVSRAALSLDIIKQQQRHIRSFARSSSSSQPLHHRNVNNNAASAAEQCTFSIPRPPTESSRLSSSLQAKQAISRDRVATRIDNNNNNNNSRPPTAETEAAASGSGLSSTIRPSGTTSTTPNGSSSSSSHNNFSSSNNVQTKSDSVVLSFGFANSRSPVSLSSPESKLFSKVVVLSQQPMRNAGITSTDMSFACSAQGRHQRTVTSLNNNNRRRSGVRDAGKSGGYLGPMYDHQHLLAGFPQRRPPPLRARERVGLNKEDDNVHDNNKDINHNVQGLTIEDLNALNNMETWPADQGTATELIYFSCSIFADMFVNLVATARPSLAFLFVYNYL